MKIDFPSPKQKHSLWSHAGPCIICYYFRESLTKRDLSPWYSMSKPAADRQNPCSVCCNHSCKLSDFFFFFFFPSSFFHFFFFLFPPIFTSFPPPLYFFFLPPTLIFFSSERCWWNHLSTRFHFRAFIASHYELKVTKSKIQSICFSSYFNLLQNYEESLTRFVQIFPLKRSKYAAWWKTAYQFLQYAMGKGFSPMLCKILACKQCSVFKLI